MRRNAQVQRHCDQQIDKNLECVPSGSDSTHQVPHQAQDARADERGRRGQVSEGDSGQGRDGVGGRDQGAVRRRHNERELQPVQSHRGRLQGLPQL